MTCVRAAACAAGARLGFPLAAKLVSPDVSHKSDIGAVQLDIANLAELEAAHDSEEGVAAFLAKRAPVFKDR